MTLPKLPLLPTAVAGFIQIAEPNLAMSRRDLLRATGAGAKTVRLERRAA